MTTADEKLVTCDDLAKLIDGTSNRVAVLVLKRPGKVQLLTFGSDAVDMVESHHLKELLKDAIFDGLPPKAETQESFILEAAQNKEKLDAATKRIETLEAALRTICNDAPTNPPTDYGFTGNSDDDRAFASNETHWHLAEIARAALAKEPTR